MSRLRPYFKCAPIAIGAPIVPIILCATLNSSGTPRSTLVFVFPLVIPPMGYLKPTLTMLGPIRLITPVVLITDLMLWLHTRTFMGCLLLSTASPCSAVPIDCMSVLVSINLAHITDVLNCP